MPRNGSTKLVYHPKHRPENPILKTSEESNQSEQIEEPVLTELDNEIECPRCHEIMELYSKFDELLYACESSSFLLKCV